MRLAFFAAASLMPVPLLAGAAVWGGLWGWVALIYLTLMAAALDEVIRAAVPDSEAPRDLPGADALSVALALGHFVVLALAVAGLAGDWLDTGEKVLLLFATAPFFGQVSNSNAHELIHRGSHTLHGLGKWIYISLLFGHHTSAHPLVHHVHVATDRDPNSARRGEGFYRFFLRAWFGSFAKAFAAESARLKRAGRPAWQHPYVIYNGGAALILIAAGALAGPMGPVWVVALGFLAQSQLLLSDYVQHYGLRRRRMPNGKAEPVSDRHSWNSPQVFTSQMMLNAPRHSDHHAHPGRKYPALRLDPEMPILPSSLLVMATLALFPGLWKRVMDPRVDTVMAEARPLAAE